MPGARWREPSADSRYGEPRASSARGCWEAVTVPLACRKAGVAESRATHPAAREMTEPGVGGLRLPPASAARSRHSSHSRGQCCVRNPTARRASRALPNRNQSPAKNGPARPRLTHARRRLVVKDGAVCARLADPNVGLALGSGWRCRGLYCWPQLCCRSRSGRYASRELVLADDFAKH